MAPQAEGIYSQEEGRFSRSVLVTADGAVKKPSVYMEDKEGIYVVANTIGGLELVLEGFKSTGLNVPVNALNIGPVTKDDVCVASLMLPTKKQYAVIFALDANITPEALDYADQLGVKIHSCTHNSDLFPQVKAFLQNIVSSTPV